MSSIKIHPGKIKYLVNEEKRTVTAVITDCKYDLETFIYLNDVRNYLPRKFDLFIRPSYIGVAVCAESDTFDVEKGKEIARRKAVKKYRNALCRAWSAYVLKVGEKFARVGDLLEEDYITADKAYIKTMTEAIKNNGWDSKSSFSLCGRS